MSEERTSVDRKGPSSRDALASLPRFQSLLAAISLALVSPPGRACLIGATEQSVDWLSNSLGTLLSAETSTARIDGSSGNPADCVSSMLGQFGYDFASKKITELLGMLRVFAVHQTDADKRPVLFIRNAHKLSAELIEIINEILKINSSHQPAIAVILLGHPPLLPRLRSLGLADTDAFAAQAITVTPLSAAEIVRYIKARSDLTLRDRQLLERVLTSTNGNPTRLDRLIDSARRSGTVSEESIAKTLDSPQLIEAAAESAARILISQSGRLLFEQGLKRERSMIGRADHNDVVLESRYVSRYHALLCKGPEDADWIVDLNSRNGTFVNSRAIDYMALRHEDVVSLGNHRIKYLNPAATGRRPARAAFAGNATAVFETLREDGVPDLSLLTQNLQKPG